MNELETGQTVAAAVTHVVPHRAFARLAEGVEGLIVAIDRERGGCHCLLVSPSAHETLSGRRS